MEDFSKKRSAVEADKDIVFSKAIKAGKRIYYLDVKKNRKDEMFIAITESKKIVQGEGDNASVSFEKHKIFLYKEDFDKFTEGLHEALDFIGGNAGPVVEGQAEEPGGESVIGESEEIKIDIDF